MKKPRLFKRNYNWRMLLMRIVVNMLALILTSLVVPNLYFLQRDLGTWLLLALGLGVLNSLVKPLIQLITLQFIFATGGLVIAFINAILLLILGWLFPARIQLTILAALLGGLVLGLTTAFLESLLGLTPPIVSERYPEIRQRVKDRQFYRTQAELAEIEARKRLGAREIATARVLVSGATASVGQYITTPRTPEPAAASLEPEPGPPLEPDLLPKPEQEGDANKSADAPKAAASGQEV